MFPQFWPNVTQWCGTFHDTVPWNNCRIISYLTEHKIKFCTFLNSSQPWAFRNVGPIIFKSTKGSFCSTLALTCEVNACNMFFSMALCRWYAASGRAICSSNTVKRKLLPQCCMDQQSLFHVLETEHIRTQVYLDGLCETRAEIESRLLTSTLCLAPERRQSRGAQSR